MRWPATTGSEKRYGESRLRRVTLTVSRSSSGGRFPPRPQPSCTATSSSCSSTLSSLTLERQPPNGRPLGAGLGSRGGWCIRGGRGSVPELPRPGPRGLGARLPRGQLRPSGTHQSEVRSGRILQLPPIDPKSRSRKRCIDLKACRYVWKQACEAEGYISVLSTYSGHRSLGPL